MSSNDNQHQAGYVIPFETKELINDFYKEYGNYIQQDKELLTTHYRRFRSYRRAYHVLATIMLTLSVLTLVVFWLTSLVFSFEFMPMLIVLIVMIIATLLSAALYYVFSYLSRRRGKQDRLFINLEKQKARRLEQFLDKLNLLNKPGISLLSACVQTRLDEVSQKSISRESRSLSLVSSTLVAFLIGLISQIFTKCSTGDKISFDNLSTVAVLLVLSINVYCIPLAYNAVIDSLKKKEQLEEFRNLLVQIEYQMQA